MAILHIRLIGDPVLRTVAEPVTEFGADLAKLIADMMETMDDVDGAGLAAPQIGVGLQIFTYRVGDQSGHMINPIITNGEDDQEPGAEGCLSVPGLGFVTPRKQFSRVTGVDLNGEPLVIEAAGMLARCLQHETDHLNGKLYVDRLAGEDRKSAFRAIRAEHYEEITARTTAKRSQTVGSSFGGSAIGRSVLKDHA
ncbi:peptide deformylase [Psychromicrobium lacuslunae]|uniref:Peptide deformylase n=1 Tax=Psychromicrobium lacuslunae TaxID=1618207 RepID=A0A0D4BWH5_9MICC|nr:peptide deformylase [Psychromicrobium lacuslunae]AJT40807.1 peptide deformylase [Psychromicrobium lacuslunae]